MSFGLGDKLQLSISKYLEVNALLKTMMNIWGSLTIEMMKEFFLGYATNSKGYRCFNKRLNKLMDCIDIGVYKESLYKERQIRSVDMNNEDTNESEYLQSIEVEEDEESEQGQENSREQNEQE